MLSLRPCLLSLFSSLSSASLTTSLFSLFLILHFYFSLFFFPLFRPLRYTSWFNASFTYISKFAVSIFVLPCLYLPFFTYHSPLSPFSSLTLLPTVFSFSLLKFLSFICLSSYPPFFHFLLSLCLFFAFSLSVNPFSLASLLRFNSPCLCNCFFSSGPTLLTAPSLSSDLPLFAPIPCLCSVS